MAETPEQDYPGVKAAYELVVPSYTWLVSRFEAADNRLTALLTLTAQLALGGPLLAVAVKRTIDFSSLWFLAGAVVFIVAMGVGIVGRTIGHVMLPDPAVIYRESLAETDWAFRKNAIYFAGLHFDANAQAIRTKGNVAGAITILLILGIVCLLVCGSRGPRKVARGSGPWADLAYLPAGVL